MATTRSNARGEFSFQRLDIGSYRVVVTAPAGGPATVSRVVTITRGGLVAGIEVGVPPASRPQPPKPVAAPAPAPAMVAAFASLAVSPLDGSPVRRRS